MIAGNGRDNRGKKFINRSKGVPEFFRDMLLLEFFPKWTPLRPIRFDVICRIKFELLRGRINILGGKVIQKIDRLQLRLIREWSYEYYGMGMDYQPGMDRCPFTPGSVRVKSQYELEEDKGEDEIYNVDLETDIEVEPEKKIIFPFEIDISKIQAEKGVQETWKLKARADIPFARDAVTEHEIKIFFP